MVEQESVSGEAFEDPREEAEVGSRVEVESHADSTWVRANAPSESGWRTNSSVVSDGEERPFKDLC